MTIRDFMDWCMDPEAQEFNIYDLDTGEVVFVGTVEDCPDLDTEFMTWDIGTNGELYFNVC